jgi:hypothetical protein
MSPPGSPGQQSVLASRKRRLAVRPREVDVLLHVAQGLGAVGLSVLSVRWPVAPTARGGPRRRRRSPGRTPCMKGGSSRHPSTRRRSSNHEHEVEVVPQAGARRGRGDPGGPRFEAAAAPAATPGLYNATVRFVRVVGGRCRWVVERLDEKDGPHVHHRSRASLAAARRPPLGRGRKVVPERSSRGGTGSPEIPRSFVAIEDEGPVHRSLIEPRLDRSSRSGEGWNRGKGRLERGRPGAYS